MNMKRAEYEDKAKCPVLYGSLHLQCLQRVTLFQFNHFSNQQSPCNHQKFFTV